MIVHPARIDDRGIEYLMDYADNPKIFDVDDEVMEQMYVPGISIPGKRLLDSPFNVPILGDDEPFSLNLSWPRNGNKFLLKRIQFVGEVPAEDITIGYPPKENDWLDIDETEDRIDAAFGDFLGPGGFLHVQVDIHDIAGTDEMNEGVAEFLLFESVEEFKQYGTFRQDHNFTAADLVTAFRLGLTLQEGFRFREIGS